MCHLIVQHLGFNPDALGRYQFDFIARRTFNFMTLSAGEYAIGVSCCSDICVGGSTMAVQLSGNMANVVPEPSTGMLLGLGVCVLGARGRSTS